MTHTHAISTTDPINGKDIKDVEGHPYVVEGDHYHDVAIYFETEENRSEYLSVQVNRPEQGLSKTMDNPTDEFIDEG